MNNDLKCLNAAACLKALKDAGLTHADIVALVKEEGREAVLAMGAEELERQRKELMT